VRDGQVGLHRCYGMAYAPTVPGLSWRLGRKRSPSRPPWPRLEVAGARSEHLAHAPISRTADLIRLRRASPGASYLESARSSAPTPRLVQTPALLRAVGIVGPLRRRRRRGPR
jgi:hypothetical protein